MRAAPFPWLALAVMAACAPTPAPDTSQAGGTTPPPRDLKAVAEALVRDGMVTAGDRVLVAGDARDGALLEEIAIAAMKVGGNLMITIGSPSLQRRSYLEVPEVFDGRVPRFDVDLMGITDVFITVDYGATDSTMMGIPPERIAARTKAADTVTSMFFKRTIRSVNLGNGLYPTPDLATALGMPLNDLEGIFWKAVAIPADTLRYYAQSLQVALKGQQTHLTAPNGTDLTFTIDLDRAFVSDGAITQAKVAQGSASASTWLPAGEVLSPIVAGSGTGTLVIDKLRLGGGLIEGLRITFAAGRVTAMEATSGIDLLRKGYDAATGQKELLSYIDLGANPAVTLPAAGGRPVWMGSGSVTLGVGDNRGWGGSVVSDFSAALPVSGATLTVDGRAVIRDGRIVP